MADKASPVLEVKGLTKDFGDFRAVDNVSFSIPRGKIIGFLGPNGAGKTTTIHMLLGSTTPAAGEIRYFGKDFYTHRAASLSKINFTSAYIKLLGWITVEENLRVFANLYGIRNKEKKIKELADYMEIQPLMKKLFWDLSAGQKTRVTIVKALLNDPELILMDEPTASLDPDIADKVLTLVENLRKDRNVSILFTSHKMDEVTRICDRVVFLQQGKVIAEDTPKNLVDAMKGTRLQLTFTNPKKEITSALDGMDLEHTFQGQHIVSVVVNEPDIPKVLFDLSKKGIWMSNIDIQKGNLEDVFLHIARENKS